MIFEAENKAALAKGIFEDQVKKAAVHRQHMMSILEGQMELLKNFSEDTENKRGRQHDYFGTPR